MKINLLILFLLCAFLFVDRNVFGQSFCGNTGKFLVTPSEGCAPLTVNITNQMVNAENVTYAYDFNKNSTSPPEEKDRSFELSHVYDLPGTYTILQYGSIKDVAGFSLCKDVIVKENRAPKAELMTCNNGRARLTIISDSISQAYNAIEINWGDGSSQSVSIKNNGALFYDHQYATGGNFPAITVQGKYATGICTQGLKTTLTKETAPQSLAKIRIRSVEMLPSGDAKILYDGMEGIATEIWIDKGDGQFVTTGKGGQSDGAQAATITGLNPQQIYRFKLSSKNFCENLIDSPVVSSMVVKEGAVSLDEIISVSWEHYPNTDNLLQYQLKRDGVVIFSSLDQLSYLDTDVKCGTTYQYEIVAIIENDVRSYSTPFSIAPKSAAPETITTASVTVKDEKTITTQVALSGEGLTSSYDLIVERATLGSQDFQQISQPDNQSLLFDDVDVNTSENAYCYRFTYENACNLRSPAFSAPVCSILLQNRITDVHWNADSPFTAGVASYNLIQMNDAGTVQDEIPKQLATSHMLDIESQSAFSFQVKAQSNDGNMESYSNVLSLRRNPIVLIPDAFTPNGDAHNERFEVKAYFVSTFSMSVFTRWGEVVFQTENSAESWDGNIKNEKAPGGYYLYKIEITDATGQQISKNGSFLLIR
ncbi:gliding motility-associated C-terminal domain-containing protein [Dyadobacter sp. LJ53]|uniref:T9SS type B sorting domain-containing protein n=1 Tax=Dyadobacter chenwenxiniae TaxID=2906456 RepID=UPI001F3B4F04|nr:gliding motility-associated C-terminal domain-containing protein [Dyadobacter chenwenxiniae]MCF0049596.1 gliding motility-associated C-terminal domain-containing protein [Dyadobacter chenwenxiniae]